MRVHPVLKGCRLLVTSSLHRGKTAPPNEQPGAPQPQELVVQLFADPQGKSVHLTDLNDEAAGPAPPIKKFCARAIWRLKRTNSVCGSSGPTMHRNVAKINGSVMDDAPASGGA